MLNWPCFNVNMQTTATLNSLLAALATGEAREAIEDIIEDLYPVSYDPATGLLIQSEDN